MPPEFLQAIAELEVPRQAGADYGLSKSLVLKEELARYWRIAGDLYSRYVQRQARHDLRARQVGVEEWLVPLLSTILGYDDLVFAGPATLGERVFKLTHRACRQAVPLLLTTRDFNLDRADPRFGYEGRRQAPHGLMQEYLNAEDDCLWGIVSNGSKLRVLRDNPSLTRPSYIEADLDLVFAEELYPDFAALWLATHASRFTPANGKPSTSVIEGWRVKAHETGERVLENLRDGVTEALRQLGNGLLQHPDNDGLRSALREGTLTPEAFFEQLLRLVYRMLFLFTAEERDLLHSPDAIAEERAVYAQGYSLSRLRERALRRRYYDHHADIWAGLQITFRALAHGAPPLGLPALGGLFRLAQCPDLDRAAIANEQLLDAVRSLTFFHSNTALARVNYRDMGTEELGSVYESLLELQPALDLNGARWTFGFVGLENGKKSRGSERKLTGSYYTPSSLVNELIKSALEPVLAETIIGHPDNPRKAILDLKVLDPACGSGHFLLAAARRMAAEIARIEADADTFDEATRQHALREVVQHCIHGVDRNPLAVELCKTALWIETVEPGKPLTFLDAHIQLGDSLVGLLDPEVMANGIPAAAYRPLTGDVKTLCQALRKQNSQATKSSTAVQRDLFDEESVAAVALATADIDAMPEDTLDDIERKSAAWATARRDETRKREELRANLFVGAYFAPKTKEAASLVPHTEDLNRLKIGMAQRIGVEEKIQELARRHRFFHWHLAFAEIMQDGGFDVVLGNPPWERIKLQEQEFFASRSHDIATARNKAARDRLIKQLDRGDALPAEKALFAAFEDAKRESEAISQFARTGGRFPLTGVGDINTYAVFAETFLQLVGPQGRAGLIVPTGIATDNSTRAFFDQAVTGKRLVSLYDFENREPVFPGVHRSYKFCLLTLSGADLPCPEAEFAFFLHQAEQLGEKERRFTLSADDFALFNPNTRTCPIFRTRRDMEIARKMYRRAGVFWREKQSGRPEANPWGISFQRMFDMSNDSGLFRTQDELVDDGWELRGNVFTRDGERYLPLYEAKLFHQYDHRFSTFDGVPANALKNGTARAMTREEKADPEAVVVPRYWVPEEEVKERLDKSEMTPTLFEPSRAEPSRAEPSRAEPSRAEPSRAEPSRAEPSRAEPSRAEPSRAEPSRAEPSRAEPSRAEPSRAEPSRAEPSRAEPSRAEPSRAEPSCYSTASPSWLATRSQEDHSGDRRADGDLRHDSHNWIERLRYNGSGWLIVFRDISRATDQRTSIFAAIRGTAVSNKAPLVDIDFAKWLQVFRGITNSTNERTFLTGSIPWSGVGNSAPVVDYERGRAVASVLVLSNMNSLPLDWAARLSVGGVNMNFFIVKQLPVLPPEAYLERMPSGLWTYAEIIVPRALELTYTAVDLEEFARDIGYDGQPFPWDARRRHCLQSELDATYAHMYGLDRTDMEWILEPHSPSSSFPALKRNELANFGEYRTRRLVLTAYDQLARGESPDLEDRRSEGGR